jgi:nitroimidazol reductase NimA-like FMN-containing flavoprotein (pyridoxamine 5'-phosphate oxidase superfamily)
VDAEQLRVRLEGALVEGDTAEAALAVLGRVQIGFLAMAGDGWPYAVPINFAYADPAVYFHGGGLLKSSLLARDARVCLAAVAEPEFVHGDGPCDDNFRFESVLVFGMAELVEDDAQRDDALRIVVAKYDLGARDAAFPPNTFKGTQVYRVAVEAMTYKRNT